MLPFSVKPAPTQVRSAHPPRKSAAGSGLAGKKVGYRGDLSMADAMLAGADAFCSVLGGMLPRPVISKVRAALARDAAARRDASAAMERLQAVRQPTGDVRAPRPARAWSGKATPFNPAAWDRGTGFGHSRA